MSIESGSVLLIDINGALMAVTPGSAIPGGTSAFLQAGTDGSNARVLSVDSTGRSIIAGAGVAGTPAGGVVSMQGVSGGTPIPISGTVTATNASTGATGSAVPASATYIGASDGTNLVGLRVKAASTAAVASDPSLVVALSPNSPIPTGANVIGAVTQSGTWTSIVTQPTASNLNALVAQGAAGTAAAGWFVKLTDGTNTAPTMDVAARRGFQAITDGTNTAAVKAASTAPLSTDTSLVVVLSPNQQPIPVTISAGTDRTSTGSITTTQNVSISTQASGTCGILVTGTWTGSLTFEASVDGTTFVVIDVADVSGTRTTTTTVNGTWLASVAGFAQFRVRGATVVSGSATVFLDSATGTTVVSLGDPLPTGANTIGAVNQGTAAALAGFWPVRMTDGTNTMPTMDTVSRRGFMSITDGTNGPSAVKAASTAAVATDPSLVVTFSPNTGLPTGANVIGAVTQSGSWTNAVTQATAANLNATVVGLGTAGASSGGVLSIQGVSSGTPVPISGTVTANNSSVSTTGSAVPASATYIGASDGTNLVGLRIKAASTAASATDPSLVVALSPNSPIPTGANVIGAVTQSGTWTSTVTQAVAANLNATVVQSTASSLNATVTGSGTAGTPAAGVVTVQGATSMTALLTTEKRSSTSNVTSVASSATSVNLLTSNANRVQAIIHNDSSAVCYVKLGTTASASSFTYRLTPQSNLIVDGQWTGNIDAIWVSATGNARITELT